MTIHDEAIMRQAAKYVRAGLLSRYTEGQELENVTVDVLCDLGISQSIDAGELDMGDAMKLVSKTAASFAKVSK
jgi:hypothetical protein